MIQRATNKFINITSQGITIKHGTLDLMYAAPGDGRNMLSIKSKTNTLYH